MGTKWCSYDITCFGSLQSYYNIFFDWFRKKKQPQKYTTETLEPNAKHNRELHPKLVQRNHRL